MGPQFPLNDLALLALVHELDRVFETDDVETPSRVQVIDHRCQRRRLARAGRASHENHALVVIAELLDDGWQAELVERRYLRWDRAKCCADARFLAEYVHTKASTVRRYIREIDILTAPEHVLVLPAHDLGDIAFELRLAQIAELDRQQIAMHAQHGRDADREVDVRAALIGAQLQECVDTGHI